jgi:hypothetical protein
VKRLALLWLLLPLLALLGCSTDVPADAFVPLDASVEAQPASSASAAPSASVVDELGPRPAVFAAGGGVHYASSFPVPPPGDAGTFLVSTGQSTLPSWQSGAANVTLAGDVTGPGNANTLVNMTGSGGLVTVPSANVTFGTVSASSGAVRFADSSSSNYVALATYGNTLTWSLLSYSGTGNPVIEILGNVDTGIQMQEGGGGVGLKLQANATSGLSLSLGGTTAWTWTGNTTNTLQIGSSITGFNLDQAGPASDVAPANWLVSSQSAYTGATTNVNGGNITLQPGAPTTHSGTAGTGGNVIVNVSAPNAAGSEAGLIVQRSGTQVAQLGPQGPSYTGLWFGTFNGASTYAFLQKNDGTLIDFNCPVNTGSIDFGFANSASVILVGPSASANPNTFYPQSDNTVAFGLSGNRWTNVYAVNINVNGATSLGSGAGVLAMANATTAPSSSPSGGIILWASSANTLNLLGSTGTALSLSNGTASTAALIEPGTVASGGGVALTIQGGGGGSGSAAGGVNVNGGVPGSGGGVTSAVNLQTNGTTTLTIGDQGMIPVSVAVTLTSGSNVNLTQSQYKFPTIIINSITAGSGTKMTLPNAAGLWYVDMSAVTISGSFAICCGTGCVTMAANATTTGLVPVLCKGSNAIVLNE